MEQVLLKCSELKESCVTMSKDSCPTICLAKNKLVEFGKRFQVPFQLRFEKFFVKGEVYYYNADDDSVSEISSSSNH